MPPGVVSYRLRVIHYISGQGTPNAPPIAAPTARTALSYDSGAVRARARGGGPDRAACPLRAGSGLALVHHRAGPGAPDRRQSQRGERGAGLARLAIRAGAALEDLLAIAG